MRPRSTSARPAPGIMYAHDRGRGADRFGPEPHRTGGRGREALHHHRLQGSVHRDPVRRRRRRRRWCAGPPSRAAGSSPPSSSPTAGWRRCCTGREAAPADPISEKVVCERSHYMKMAGREVFKAAVLAMARGLRRGAHAGPGSPPTRSTCWSRTRPTSGSSTRPRSTRAFRCRRSWSTSTATATPRPPRFRWRSTRRSAEGRVEPGLAGAAGRLRRRVHLGERRRPVVTVLMCPGQGAQRVGMGKDLAERFPAARDTFGAIDEALGVPLSRHHVGRARGRAHPHPQRPARHPRPHRRGPRRRRATGSGTIAAGAGHSLGEYSAHVAARTLTVADAARLVRRRGRADARGRSGAAGRDGRGAGSRHRRGRSRLQRGLGRWRGRGRGQPQRARPDGDLRRSRRGRRAPARAARRGAPSGSFRSRSAAPSIRR